jgi:hypothetical protein
MGLSLVVLAAGKQHGQVLQLNLALDRPAVDEGPGRASQVAEEGLAVALPDGAVPVADPVAGRAEVAAGVAAHEE